MTDNSAGRAVRRAAAELAARIEQDLTAESHGQALTDDEIADAVERVQAKLMDRGLLVVEERVVEFVADIESWLESQDGRVLARAVDTVAPTVTSDVPQLESLGLGRVVDLEADINPKTLGADVTILVQREGVSSALTLEIITASGWRQQSGVSSLGLARFTGVPLAEQAGVPITLRLRRLA